MMDAEVAQRFLKQVVDELPYAAAVRAAGIEAEFVYVLRARIACGHWQYISQHFVKPTPRRYVATQPQAVIQAMRAKGLW
jgi:hypothetical protein